MLQISMKYQVFHAGVKYFLRKYVNINGVRVYLRIKRKIWYFITIRIIFLALLISCSLVKNIDNTYKRYINSYLIQTCDKNRSIYMLYFRIVAETSTSCVFSGSGLWKKGIGDVAHISISSPRNAKS